MHRAIDAWEDWKLFATTNGVDPLGTYPRALLECWINKDDCKSGPMSRFYKARWLEANLDAPLNMAMVAKPKAAAGASAHPKQAVVAEPAMLRCIEEKILDDRTNARVVPALCTAYLLATCVLRFRHAQRSRFMLPKLTGYWCRCALGKVKNEAGARTAFYWFAPKVRMAGTSSANVADRHYALWCKMSVQVGHTLEYLAFDGETGHKLSLQQFHNILRQELRAVVGEEQTMWITSYSFRLVGATATRAIELDPMREFIFGGWTATKATTENAELRRSMPTRYNGRRAEQEERTNVGVWAYIHYLLALAAWAGSAETRGKVSRQLRRTRYHSSMVCKGLLCWTDALPRLAKLW